MADETARTSWFDGDSPALDAQLEKLTHFTDAMADGVIDSAELAGQEARLSAAMRAVEGDLDDASHAKVTALLAELTAYNIMGVLHSLAGDRLSTQFSDT
ncbi:MAG: hypothetical protein ACI9MR_001036 [Myxococcota bacterium]|jgi:hypothetical protein